MLNKFNENNVFRFNNIKSEIIESAFARVQIYAMSRSDTNFVFIQDFNVTSFGFNGNDK